MRKEAPVFNSTNSVTGYILKIKYPTAGTLKFNNNGIGHLFEEGDPVMIIPCYPNQNYRDQNVVQWKVMREFLTDDTIYYQELGVLGCAQANVLQAEGILPFPVFNRYKFKLDKWVNGRSEHQNANLYVPDMKNTIAFNRNNRDVVNTVLKSIYNLSYNYDYSFNAERIQFKSFALRQIV